MEKCSCWEEKCQIIGWYDAQTPMLSKNQFNAVMEPKNVKNVLATVIQLNAISIQKKERKTKQ